MNWLVTAIEGNGFLNALPDTHRDPFDQPLVAQAQPPGCSPRMNISVERPRLDDLVAPRPRESW